MIDFVKPIGHAAAAVSGGPSKSFAVSRETLKCSHILANFRNSKKRAYLTGRWVIYCTICMYHVNSSSVVALSHLAELISISRTHPSSWYVG